MKNKKVVISIISVVAVLLVIIGVTYAYWLVTRTQTNQNVISSGCLDISLTGEKNDIELQDQFPLSDEDGMKLTPYEFTVTNNCTTSADYHINLESVGEQTAAIKASAIKAVIDENTPKRLYEYVGAEPTISGAYESYTLLYGTLAGSSEETEEDTVTYKLRIWIDANAPISEQNKTYRSKISVSVGQNISAQGSTLASLILDDAEENNYLKTETPNFGTATADGEYGLYSVEDDLGTSYYFRGDVETNYVKFGTYAADTEVDVYTYSDYGPSDDSTRQTITAGTPMYWRIVRINGDGTIRLIYDGTTPVNNGTSHLSSIGNSGFGNQWSDDGAVYKDSYAETKLNEWYTTNLATNYGKYIADTEYCNDTEVAETKYFDDNYNPKPSIYEATIWEYYFGAYKRFNAKTPQLKCNQKNDRLTVANGGLEQPIGLITVDEVMLAGAAGTNKSFYLYTGDVMNWTMSSWLITVQNGYVYNQSMPFGVTGSFNGSFPMLLDASLELRPVINIKADALFKGTGIPGDPYELAS